MDQLPDELPGNRRTDAFERRVADMLAGALTPGEPVVVACSGGPDSVATFVAVSRSALSSTVVAAYFDHGLRPAAETEADAAFVDVLATRLGARAIQGAAAPPLVGDEASAREARYRWLADVLAECGGTTLVTGHTRDDQAETVLLNLVRGGGLRAAGGMRLESVWPIPAPGTASLRLLRPLLGVSRAEVEAYLDALGIAARIDATNEQPTYARNRVRREVLPALETVNAQARAHLASFAGRAQEAETALDEWAVREFERHGAVLEGCARVDRRRLGDLPAAVAKRVLNIAATGAGLELDSSQRQALLGIASRRGAHVDLAGAGRGWTDDRWLNLGAGRAVDAGAETA